MRALLLRWLRTATGVLLGLLTVPAELALAAVGGLWLLAAPRRARRAAGGPVLRAARRLAGTHRRRMTVWYGVTAPPREDQPLVFLGYVALRGLVGLLGGVVAGCVVIGAGYATMPAWIWAAVSVEHPLNVLVASAAGVLLLFGSMQTVHGVAVLDELLARRLLSSAGRELLQRRVDELAASRAGVVRAVHDERRRIERDLHDGVQQRLVALGLLLGRARRAGADGRRAALLRQAHEETRQALRELREVAWHVYPVALDDGGLPAALATIAERTPVPPVRLRCELPEPGPPEAVRTVACFVAAEAVTKPSSTRAPRSSPSPPCTGRTC